MARGGIDDVPAALAVPAPTRGDSGLGAVGGMAVLGPIHEAMAAAPLSGPSPGVVLRTASMVPRPSDGAVPHSGDILAWSRLLMLTRR